MKYNFSLFLFLLLCFSIITMNHVKKASNYGKSDYSVRVLLVEYDLDKDIPDHLVGKQLDAHTNSRQACLAESASSESIKNGAASGKSCAGANGSKGQNNNSESVESPSLITLKSSDGFLISDGTKGSKVFYCKSNKICINVKSHFIYINGTRYLKNQVKISPKQGDQKNADINFGKYFYQGDFFLILENKKLFLINKIDLEDYVFAVLCSETWPGWPLEVNKVFAVAIRTYVTKRAQDAKKVRRLYHIKNNSSHQNYKGHRIPNCDYELLRSAVAKTSDLILTYKGDIIDPLYDCCCGGVIPANISGKINFKKAPYLARKYECKYCKNCNSYTWQANYTINDLERLLGISNIRSIDVTKTDKAGLVKEVKIKSGVSFVKVSGDRLYKELKKIKSFCYSIKKKGKSFVIDGKGYGHHIGICQWGARQMVRQNFDFKQILEFYYPGSYLSKFPRD